MLIDFCKSTELTIPNLNGGDGCVIAKAHMDANGKIMISRLPVGSSIGLHQHATSSEINYVLHGVGMAVCNVEEELLTVGTCQYCPKGSSHSIINTGSDELILFTVVSEQ